MVEYFCEERLSRKPYEEPFVAVFFVSVCLLVATGAVAASGLYILYVNHGTGQYTSATEELLSGTLWMQKSSQTEAANMLAVLA